MNLPTSLQLSFGRTRLIVVFNIVALALFAPAIYFVANRFGGLGAAWMWLILNLGYVLFMLPLMHRRALPQHLWRWLAFDVGAPLLAVVAVVGLSRLLFGLPAAFPAMLATIAATYCAALAAAVVAAPEVRAALAAHWQARTQPKPAS
jgi:O-antigen/teichoic acid export membrane protein